MVPIEVGIMKLSNTQKKVAAVFLVVTWPIWIVPAIICYFVGGFSLVLYEVMCEALGVKNEST